MQLRVPIPPRHKENPSELTIQHAVRILATQTGLLYLRLGNPKVEHVGGFHLS